MWLNPKLLIFLTKEVHSFLCGHYNPFWAENRREVTPKRPLSASKPSFSGFLTSKNTSQIDSLKVEFFTFLALKPPLFEPLLGPFQGLFGAKKGYFQAILGKKRPQSSAKTSSKGLKTDFFGLPDIKNHLLGRFPEGRIFDHFWPWGRPNQRTNERTN